MPHRQRRTGGRAAARPVNYEEKRKAIIAGALRNHQVRSYDKETRTVTDMEGKVRAPAKQDRLVDKGMVLRPIISRDGSLISWVIDEGTWSKLSKINHEAGLDYSEKSRHIRKAHEENERRHAETQRRIDLEGKGGLLTFIGLGSVAATLVAAAYVVYLSAVGASTVAIGAVIPGFGIIIAGELVVFAIGVAVTARATNSGFFETLSDILRSYTRKQ